MLQSSKFNAIIRILFVFGRIIDLIIRIRPNSKDLLFGTALYTTTLPCKTITMKITIFHLGIFW